MSRAIELTRFPASDAADTVNVEGLASLVILNGLTAPIFIRWGDGENDPPEPTFFDWDWSVPGESLSIVPIPETARRARVRVIYGAPPAVTDVAAVVLGSACTWAPQVGPVA